jgi:DNA recombination protein RmuC
MNADLGQKSNGLQEENLVLLQKVQQLSTRLELQSLEMQDKDKTRKESFDSAKAALFDLGKELSNQLIEIHKKENKEVKEEAEKKISLTNQKFHTEFERLINMVGSLSKEIEQSKSSVDLIKQSLLSPSSAGRLAEITLENILKSSGLRSGLDYSMQYHLINEDKSRQRPDAVIFLPGGNLMVIDAKASKFLLDLELNEALGKTMNSHLKSLASKEYAANIKESLFDKSEFLGSIITLMFLPTEQAVEKIMEVDNGFITKAWEANIFPVGPSGLMNMLSFAKFQIVDNLRTKNHQMILEEVQRLLVSVASLAEHSQKIGNNVQSLVSSYDKFTASFNRNFLSKAKAIQKLGINIGNKNIDMTLPRYQLIASKVDTIETEAIETKLIEEEA